MFNSGASAANSGVADTASSNDNRSPFASFIFFSVYSMRG
jgi:hypothetical protein